MKSCHYIAMVTHVHINAGKAIHASVGRIALSMCLTCASSGLLQTCISGLVQIYKRDETFNANEIANSVLGALVAITGCCPFIEPPWAILIGRKEGLERGEGGKGASVCVCE